MLAEKDKPDTSSDAADEGTCAHELAAMALKQNKPAGAFTGRLIRVGKKDWEITEEMAENIQTWYLDKIQERLEEYHVAGAVDVQMIVEERVYFDDIIQQPDSFGTSDVILLVFWADGTALIDVGDLKYGYGMVFADRNEQMMTYALGVLQTYDLVANFTRARMTIYQPRREHISEWECTVEELFDFAEVLRTQADKAQAMHDEILEPEYVPGEKQCQWCKAKPSCPALRKMIEETVGAEFDDLTTENAAPRMPAAQEEKPYGDILANCMAKLDLIEDWCRSVRAAVEAELYAGREVPGYKLVAGKKGNRSWKDKLGVEKLMKEWRLKQTDMYDFSLISPTTAEKRLKKTNPRRWSKLQDWITQSDGRPHVAPITDKREALTVEPVEDEFDDLPTE